MEDRGLADRMLDRYAIGAKLGSGGFGTVYRARHTILGTDVALKVLSPQHASSPEVVQRFLREAKAAASVGSPHIVTVHDAGVADGVPFLAMELLAGEDLEARIARRGALPVGDAVDIVLQVLEGLDAAHARGIVHRDMKPANVFLTDRGGRSFVKLLDFGVSKIVEPEQRRLTQTGHILGTPAYMAPEQIMDMRNVDARADLYAVAVILYEAVTGRLPYAADSFGELMARIAGAQPDPLERWLPSAPPALCALIARGLRAQPAERFASAAEMARALAEVRAAPVTHGAFAAAPSTGPLAGAPPSYVATASSPAPSSGPLAGAPPSYVATASTPAPSSHAAPLYPPGAPGSAPSAPAAWTPAPAAPAAWTPAPAAPSAPAWTRAPAAPSAPAPRSPPAQRSTGLWLAVGALAVLLPIACIGGVALTLFTTEPAPDAVPEVSAIPAPPPQPVAAPPAPSVPLPTLPAARPEEPPPPPDTAPDGAPLAVAIPSGADPCTVPVEHDIDCDRSWDERVADPCRAAGGRELHVIGTYGSGGPVTLEIARTAAPIVLVLSSYAATEWRVRLAEGARVERVVASSYSRSRVTGLPSSVPVDVHVGGRRWPTSAWSWDGLNGHWRGSELASVAERELGMPMRAYAGCYAPTRVRIGQRAP